MTQFATLPTIWPVSLTYGDLELAPLRYSHRKQWYDVRRRNAAWLTPWEATDPTGNQPAMTYGAMIRAHNKDGAAGLSYPWAIFRTIAHEPKPRLVGQLIAAPVLWGSMRSTSLGYWVDKAHAGQNIMPTAVALASDYLFTRVGLHRIEINIVPDNAASLRVVEKLGYRSEGLRKDYIHINGQWRDHQSFALTRDEIPAEGLISRLE
jgi:ribosomal-protein-alanine N-acetyltransferase